MARLPSRSSSRRLRRRIPSRSTTLAPPQPFTFETPAYSGVDTPRSWLEMVLFGYQASFRFMLNNEWITLNLMDPSYLAGIVTEGMELGLNAYNSYMNHGLVTYPSNPNLPHDLTELPLFHPIVPGVNVLSPNSQPNNTFTDIPVTTSDPYAPPSHQPAPPPPNNAELSEEDTTPLPSMALQQGIRPKVYVLNSMKSFIVEEEYIKKYILKCPVRLNKCTMDIRVITNPDSKKFAVFLVPTLLPLVNLPVQTDSPNAVVHDDDEEPPKMTLMIWNCRGSEQTDFRKSYRSMLDYHRPAMVLLLETHMPDHHGLVEEFGFTSMANVPAIGGRGGIALVWKKDSLDVDKLAINNEEIHCTIKIVNPPAE